MASSVATVLGYLISKYDETALEGVRLLTKHTKESVTGKKEGTVDGAAADEEFVTAFLKDGRAVEAFLNLFKRKGCDMTAVYLAVPTLLDHCKARAVTVSFAHTLCSTFAFTFQLRKDLDAVTDKNTIVLNAALACMTSLVPLTAEVLLSRIGGGTLPLHLEALKRTQLTFDQQNLRFYRTQFLVSFLTAPLKTRRTVSLLRAHGFLRLLFQDLGDLLKAATNGNTNTGGVASLAVAEIFPLVSLVLDQFSRHFVQTKTLTTDDKRRLLAAQYPLLAVLIKLMATEESAIGEKAMLALQQIVLEVREPAEDYVLQKEGADDAGMPNFLLFTMLRMLRPKRRNDDSHLLSFILNRCPDLYRPFMTRASRHLISTQEEKDDGRSPIVRSMIVCNVMTRLFMAPIPFHLTSRAVILLPAGTQPVTFYQLSPASLVDEICPAWLGEYLQKLIAQDTLLYVTWALQTVQAAMHRAQRVLGIVYQMEQDSLQQKEGGNQQHGAANANTAATSAGAATVGIIDWDSFNAEVDTLLKERLPKREEIWHRVTRQLLPSSNHRSIISEGKKESSTAVATANKERAKAQFVLQRAYRLMLSYSDIFNLRTPWITALPTPTMAWDATNPNTTSSVVAPWDADTIAATTALLLSNLTRHVKLARLFHISVSGDDSGSTGGAKKSANKKGSKDTTVATGSKMTTAPALMDLIYWYCAHRSNTSDIRGCYGIARLVLWVVHSTSVRFAVDMSEVALWLDLLTIKTVPMFLHFINSLSSRTEHSALGAAVSSADNNASAATHENRHGLLVGAAEAFVLKTNEKMETRLPERDSAWQQNQRQTIKSFHATIEKVKQSWSKKNDHAQDFVNFSKSIPTIMSSNAKGSTAQQGENAATLQADAASVISTATPVKQIVLAVQGQVPVNPKSDYATVFLQAENIHQNTSEAQIFDRNGPLYAELITPFQFNASSEDSAIAGFERFLPWLADLSVCHRLLYLTENYCNNSTAPLNPQFHSTLLTFLVKNRKQLAATWANLSLAHCCALSTLIFAAWKVVAKVAEEENKKKAGSDSEDEGAELQADLSIVFSFDIAELEALVLSVYGGSSSIGDRALYATLLWLSAYTDPAGPNERVTGTTEAVVGDSESDSNGDAGSHSSDSEDDASPSAAAVKDGASSDDDDEVLAPKKKNTSASSSEEEEGDDMPVEGDKLRKTRPQKKVTKKKGHGTRIFALKSLLRGRFVVGVEGDVGTHRDTVPETRRLSAIIGHWLEDTAIQSALQLPLAVNNRRGHTLLTSLYPELIAGNTAPAAGVSAPALGTSTSQLKGLLSVDALGSPDAFDPRYLLPLIYTVACIHRRKLTFVNSGVLVRCFPVVVRGLSCASGSLRRVAMSTMAMIHDMLPTLQRHISNSARLFVHYGMRKNRTPAAIAAGGSKTTEAPETEASTTAADKKVRTVKRSIAEGRLLAAHSAFLVSAIPVLRNPKHPLFQHVVKAITTGGSSKFPLVELMTVFPTLCFTGDPLVVAGEADGAAATGKVKFGGDGEHKSSQVKGNPCPPHLLMICQVVQNSVVQTTDYTLLQRSGLLPNLLQLLQLSLGTPHVSELIASTLQSLLIHSGDPLASKGLAKSLNLMFWCQSVVQELIFNHCQSAGKASVNAALKNHLHSILRIWEAATSIYTGAAAASSVAASSGNSKERALHALEALSLVRQLRDNKALTVDVVHSFLNIIRCLLPVSGGNAALLVATTLSQDDLLLLQELVQATGGEKNVSAVSGNYYLTWESLVAYVGGLEAAMSV